MPRRRRRRRSPRGKRTKKKAEPKRDLIAEALKKDDAKKSEQKKWTRSRRESPDTAEAAANAAESQPKFDPREMQALLDKRTPQRKEATGDTLSDAAALGTRTRLSAATHAERTRCASRDGWRNLWNPPRPARRTRKEIVVVIRMRLKPDGTLAGAPRVTSSGQSPLFMAARDSRNPRGLPRAAVQRC